MKATVDKSKKDVLQVLLSDMHTGSNRALFISREWHGKNTSHVPRTNQIQIRTQFEKFMDYVKETRKGKRVVLINDGDAIEGVHHNNVDVCTRDTLEQADIHIELMCEFQKRISWQAGDLLYYVQGTEVHTGDIEDYIGRELGAQQHPDNLYATNHLELNVYGVVSHFVHHGSAAGKGANEGNGLRNWLRDMYFDYMKAEQRAPDIIYNGHVHNPTYNTFVVGHKMKFRTIHGVILPSWQEKTRHAYKVAPIAKNKIGGVTHEIKADGTIGVPVFNVMETKQMQSVTI
jgi:hypothetical protein